MIEKVVLITGGDKGIGRAVVETLATQYKTVVFTYNSNESGAGEICKLHQNCRSFQLDLRNRDSAKELYQMIDKEYGGVDILVNNAGYDRDAIFSKMEEDVWDDVLTVNLKALHSMTKPAVLNMQQKGWGRIVNLTSIAGFTGAFGKSNYAAAKAGMVALTKSLSLELATKGITCNSIAPGAIETDMFLRIPDKYRLGIIDHIPMKRMGSPQEVANVVEFLVSDKASYVTGQTIHVNGGSYL